MDQTQFAYNSIKLYFSDGFLVNFTDQGIKNVKDSPKRAEAFKTAAEKTGGKLLNLYYTLGKHDIVAIVEAPNDEAIASVLFATGSQGNARTKTLAFPMFEAANIIKNLP
ncbi:MAG: GYD domain-containing protein [Candidatus Nitrosopolaris sp.]